MKGKIFDLKRFAVHDGPGIRTTVFFAGCPLRCVWCHNPEGITPVRKIALFSHKCTGCGRCAAVCPTGAHGFSDGTHTVDRTLCTFCGKCAAACPTGALTLWGKEVEVKDLLPDLVADRDFYENSGGGVTLSGGECLLQADFAAGLLAALKKEGIHTAVDTCGFVPPTAFDRVLPYTDLFLYDVKAFDSAVHERCTGRPNALILENLCRLSSLGCEIEVRIPLVPGYNDGEVPAIADFLSSLDTPPRVRVLPYHNFAASKYRALGLPDALPERLPTKEEIAAAEAALAARGLCVCH